MYIIKRDGRRESVRFDKITSRIEKLCYGLNPKVRFCFLVGGLTPKPTPQTPVPGRSRRLWTIRAADLRRAAISTTAPPPAAVGGGGGWLAGRPIGRRAGRI